jgi:ribosomal subunit interface protein
VEIVITGRHTDVSDRFRALAEEKMTKVAQLAPKAHRVDIELSHEKNRRQSSICEKVEITVRDKGPVVRAEACADDPIAAFDIAFGKLQERLRRLGDKRKVHHGRQTPASLRIPSDGAPSALLDPDAIPEPLAGLSTANGTSPDSDGDTRVSPGSDASRKIASDPAASKAGYIVDHQLDNLGEGNFVDGPLVIRTKDHDAIPMTLDQALYEMELVGHDFFLFIDAPTGRPSVVYRRHGYHYGVIRLQKISDLPAAVSERVLQPVHT